MTKGIKPWETILFVAEEKKFWNFIYSIYKVLYIAYALTIHSALTTTVAATKSVVRKKYRN